MDDVDSERDADYPDLNTFVLALRDGQSCLVSAKSKVFQQLQATTFEAGRM